MLEISKREIISRLKAVDNPWWDERPVPEEWMYADLPRRAYFNAFHSLCCESGVRRAPVLMGPRRVGKTVMLHQTIHQMIQDGWNPRHILFASVDTPLYTGLPLETFVNILIELHKMDRNTPFAVFFDEIQYLRDWEVHLKSLVDSYPKARFVASGSAAAALRAKSRESGAGRFSDFMLPPLTFAEYLAFIGREKELIGKDAKYFDKIQLTHIDQLNEEFVNYVNYGGYPEAVTSPNVRRDAPQFIRRDIIDKALLRDIPSLYGINDVQELYRLFTVVAYNTGEEFTFDGLSKASGVKKATLRKYIEYLEAAFLIIKVRRVDETGKAFKRERGFKLYLTNPSIRAALFQPIGPDDDAMGHLAETAFFSQWFHAEEMDTLRYARWKGGEVDFIQLNATLKPAWAVEIKWADRYFKNPQELGALLAFTEKATLHKALATTRTAFGFTQVGEIGISHIPCSLYAYWIGKEIVQGKVTDISSKINLI